MKKFILSAIVFCLGVFLLTGTLPVWAHDGEIGSSGSEITISGIGGGAALEFTHDDEAPYKGWLTCWVQNTGSTAWLDFHITFCGWEFYGSVPSPLFDDVYAPTSSQSNFSYGFDNDTGGATFDFYFGSDPLGTGETAWFKVWTDNTADSNDWFDIEIYPTATVPVPSAIILLCSGLAGLLAIRRKIG